MDPGIRKFLTGYSPQGRVDVIGTNTNDVLDKCLRRTKRTKAIYRGTKVNLVYGRKHVSSRKRTNNGRLYYRGKRTAAMRPDPAKTGIDSLRCIVKVSGNRLKKMWRNRVWRAKRKYHAAELKTQNVTRNLHYRAAHYLLRRYKTVIYPHFNAHEIAQGKLRPHVKRRLQALGFYKFSQRLIQTASFYHGATVLRGSEAYTTKQCGKCGFLNDSIGESEVFTCEKCNSSGDRDVHAGRNILLRFMQPVGDVYEVSML